MPEGNHGNQNKLRPLVKGMFRIAFTAQDNLIDQSKPVQIVPTGLYYENYVKFDKVLCVNYGKPLDLANYHKLYKEKPALAINRLKKDLSDALSECMINIKSQKYYESINFVTNTFSKYYSKTIKQSYFEVLKDFTEKFNIFEEKKAIFLPQFHEFVTSYTRLLDKYNLRDWVIKRQPFSLIKITWVIGLLILSFPLFIPGFVLNYLPFTVPVKPTKKIKDLQFHSSVRYVILVLFMIFYYPIISVAVGFIFKSYLWGIITFFGSFFLGIISLKISYLYKKIMAMLRFNKLKKNNIGEAHLLISLREKIQIFTDFVFKS